MNVKKIMVYFVYTSLLSQPLIAQNLAATAIKELTTIYIYPEHSIHFLSPEPIKYVDISTHKVKGDLPVENMLRIKLQKDSLAWENSHSELGTLTIVGEGFISQYRLCASEIFRPDLPTLVELNPENSRTLDLRDGELTEKNMREIALDILSKKVGKTVSNKKNYGLNVTMNNIYTIGDYIFLDLEFSNLSKLSYQVDEFRLFIEDKKVLKSSNFQSIEIKPLWQFMPINTIKSKNRNVYVIKKAIFPGSKLLRLSLTEKQISGRMIDLKIDYKDILNAESL